MAVKIRLKRLGKVRVPQYRIVVVDSRKKRDGRVIEEIGKYHPKEDPSYIDVVSDRAQYWLSVGAQPSDAVAAILKITGDFQKYHGLPGAEGTLKTADAKRDKLDIFNMWLAHGRDLQECVKVVVKRKALNRKEGKEEWVYVKKRQLTGELGYSEEKCAKIQEKYKQKGWVMKDAFFPDDEEEMSFLIKKEVSASNINRTDQPSPHSQTAPRSHADT